MCTLPKRDGDGEVADPVRRSLEVHVAMLAREVQRLRVEYRRCRLVAGLALVVAVGRIVFDLACIAFGG